METKYKLIPKLQPHPNCQGHAMAILDDTYETKDSRDLLTRILDREIAKLEK